MDFYPLSTVQVVIMGSKPKAPKQTAAQKAFDIEQRKALNEETIDANRRQKALGRNQLGAVTLLSGLPGGPGEVADGGTSPSSPASPINSGSPRRIKSKPGGVKLGTGKNKTPQKGIL